MSPVEGNMDMLYQAVMGEARSEADKILSDAREKAEAIRSNAQEQAAAERKNILDRANMEADRIHRQTLATAQIKARTIQLEQREKLMDRAFEAAHQQLTSVQSWSDYDKIAVKLLREALAQLDTNKAVIQADEKTLQSLTQETLDKLSNELHMELRVKGPLKQGTGIVVETEDGRRRYDNTLETRLSRMQDTLRAPVYRLLMGESI